MNSMMKRSTESALSISRVSQSRGGNQERYLTREEVLNCSGRNSVSPNHTEETYLNSQICNQSISAQFSSLSSTLG